MTIKINLRNLRKMKDLSQEELAESLGISRQSIISLERGEFLPSLPLFLDMVNFFQTPIEEMIECDKALNINLPKGGEKTMARDVTPWSPFREVGSLHEAIDRMFEDSFFGGRMVPATSMTVPTVNVRETERDVIIEAEVPGVSEEDLDIEVNEDAVMIRGQKKTEEETKEKDYYRREFAYGAFSRTVPLPVAVETDKAEADLKKGVLKITLPKVQETKPKGKKISVKKMK